MTSKETFTHYQPLGNSDPAHTATAPGGLSAKAPAMTPLMLDTSTRKLVAWDGTTDGAAVGSIAVIAYQIVRAGIATGKVGQQGCIHTFTRWVPRPQLPTKSAATAVITGIFTQRCHAVRSQKGGNGGRFHT